MCELFDVARESSGFPCCRPHPPPIGIGPCIKCRAQYASRNRVFPYASPTGRRIQQWPPRSERGGHRVRWLLPPLPRLIPMPRRRDKRKLGDMPRRRDEVTRRRYWITPAPPAPAVIGLGWTRSDTDRSEPERPHNRSPCCDLLQFRRIHRELLFRLAALPLPEAALPHTEKRQGAHDYFLCVYRPTGSAR
jgi:hypothetical protein